MTSATPAMMSTIPGPFGEERHTFGWALGTVRGVMSLLLVSFFWIVFLMPPDRAFPAPCATASQVDNVRSVGYDAAMPWRTYTPDGRTLDVDYADGTWVASSDDGRGVGKTAAEAIYRSLREAATPIGSSPAILDRWVVQQAARLELELEELDPDDG